MRLCLDPLRWFFSSRTFATLPHKTPLTARATGEMNRVFERVFPAAAETVAFSDNVVSTKTNSIAPSVSTFIQPGRTYREELYASRRFELSPTQAPSSALRKLNNLLNDECVSKTVRARRYFVRPGLVKHAILYAGRRKRFNRIVRDTITRALSLHESQK